MHFLDRTPRLAALAAVALLAGCASTHPIPYTKLASAPQLAPNPEDTSGRVPYRYASHADWRQYPNAVLDPVEIYQGNDHQFEDVSTQDRVVLARYMEGQFREALGRRFTLASLAAPGTVRIKVTLTGAKTSSRIVSTILRFDLAGGPYNAVQAARGGEGALTGSVSYAVEIFDASTQRLLYAYVGKQFPNAWNIQATFGALDASKVGIEKAAEDLVTRLN